MKKILLITLFLCQLLYATPAQVPNEGLKAEMENRWDDANQIYKDILANDASRVDLWLRLANNYAHQKNMEQVIYSLQKAIEITPEDATLYNRLSEAYGINQESRKAFESMKNALKYDNTNVKYQERYGILAELNKEWDLALKNYEQMLEQNPSRVDIWKRASDIYALNKNLPKTISALKEIVKQNPRDTLSQYKLARAYSLSNQPKKSLEHIDLALKQEPENVKYLKMKAHLAVWAVDYKKQYEAYNKLLRLHRDDYQALEGLAHAALKLGNHGKAISIYRRHLQKHPKDLKIWLKLATVEQLYVNVDKALATLEKAAKTNGLIQTTKSKKTLSIDKEVPILEYHCVGDRKNRYFLEKKEFEAQMRLLKSRGYESVFVDDIYNATVGGKALPEKPIAITFDDGCSQIYTNAYPILKKYGFKAEFYLVTDAIGISQEDREYRLQQNLIDQESGASSYLIWPEAKKMLKNGMRFGSHSSTHYKLSNLKEKEMAYQVLHSKIALKVYLGINADNFSYPFGDNAFNQKFHKILDKYGYKTALAAYGGIENLKDLNRHNIRRIVVYGDSPSDGVKGVSVSVDQNNSHMAFLAHIEPTEAETNFQKAKWLELATKYDEAIIYLTAAIVLEPTNLRYLKQKAKLASFVSNHKLSSATYLRIYELEPTDANLLLFAKTASWANRLDESAHSYAKYVHRNPQDQKALIEYAKVESWRGGYHSTLELLKRYKEKFGEDEAYLRAISATLSWSRPSQAFHYIDKLLQRDSDDYEAIFAKAVSLRYTNRPQEAYQALERVQELRPDSNDTKLLQRFITTPYRSYLYPNLNYYFDSDDISIISSYLAGRYFVDLDSSLYGGVGQDLLRAKHGSIFVPINGGEQITHSKAWIGVTHRVDPEWSIDGYIGVAKVSDKPDTLQDGISTFENEAIYGATVNWRASDTFNAKLGFNHAYFLASPKSVSLDTTKDNINFAFNWYPSLLYTIGIQAGYDNFSDDNERWSLNTKFTREVARTQYWNIDVGIETRHFGYDLDLDNGYYDPELSQTYFLVAYAYWKLNQDNGVSFIISGGASKDDRTEDFEFASSINVEGTFGIYHDWLLFVRGGWDYNVQQLNGAYDGAIFTLGLKRRF